MAAASSKGNAPVSSEEKIARLLGLLLIKDLESVEERVLALRSAGFQVAEVANLLSITENHVMVATSLGRKRKKTGSKGKN